MSAEKQMALVIRGGVFDSRLGDKAGKGKLDHGLNLVSNHHSTPSSVVIANNPSSEPFIWSWDRLHGLLVFCRFCCLVSLAVCRTSRCWSTQGVVLWP